MALVLGTNCGFVTVAPTADPADGNLAADGSSLSVRHTSPGDADKIVEIGWWCDTASDESNFEVGLYTDDGGADPNAQLFVSATNAKGTDAGWKSAVVDWDIDPSTIYWLAFQLDAVPGTTNTNNNLSGGAGLAVKTSQTALPSPWGASGTTDTDAMIAIYAVYQAAAGGDLLPLLQAIGEA